MFGDYNPSAGNTGLEIENVFTNELKNYTHQGHIVELTNHLYIYFWLKNFEVCSTSCRDQVSREQNSIARDFNQSIIYQDGSLMRRHYFHTEKGYLFKKFPYWKKNNLPQKKNVSFSDNFKSFWSLCHVLYRHGPLNASTNKIT